jgi:pantoate--beta-alanine ligase
VILAERRSDLHESLVPVRDSGRVLGFVPTMGYLHDGHLSLVDRAREASDFLAVSIFVNPLQFGPEEDLARYPQNLERDRVLLEERGVDLIFSPTVQEMYPWGEPQVSVDPGPMAHRLCGPFRPGHFKGVLTVVARLFGLFRPQISVFGQKDFQQAVLIRRMVEDLEMGVEVLTAPIVREPDGLALSSRNVFLSEEERANAQGLRKGILQVQAAFDRGERSGRELRSILADQIRDYPLLNLQYGEIVHPLTLDSLDQIETGSVVAVAAYCGQTRLIDNHTMEG